MTRQEAQQMLQSNENLRKFLDVLSITEGTSTFKDPYLAQGGTNGKLLATGYQAHPTALGQGKWQFTDKLGRTQYATANGKYAIRYPTWQGVEKAWGKMDFSPASQDQAAVYLINQRGALQDVMNGDWNAALPKLGKEWASLPTAPDSYQQFRHTWDGVADAFKKAGLKYDGPGSSSTGTSFAQTRAPVGGGLNMQSLQNGQNPGASLINQMFQKPTQQQFSSPAISQVEPQQYRDIQWLLKPTGMYGV